MNKMEKNNKYIKRIDEIGNGISLRKYKFILELMGETINGKYTKTKDYIQEKLEKVQGELRVQKRESGLGSSRGNLRRILK